MNKTIWLAKYVKEFKSKTRPQDSNLKNSNSVLNSAMALLKGREMVFKAFEKEEFSRLEQLEQSE